MPQETREGSFATIAHLSLLVLCASSKELRLTLVPPLSATDTDHAADARHGRTSSVYTKYQFDNPRKVCAMRSSSFAASSATMSRLFPLLSAQGFRERCSHVCAAARPWNLYQNGLTEQRPLRGAHYLQSATCLAKVAPLYRHSLGLVLRRPAATHRFRPVQVRPAPFPASNRAVSGTRLANRAPGLAASQLRSSRPRTFLVRKQ